MASTVHLKQLRCGCHKLLMEVSSTSSARIEARCPRCKKDTTFMVSTGDR